MVINSISINKNKLKNTLISYKDLMINKKSIITIILIILTIISFICGVVLLIFRNSYGLIILLLALILLSFTSFFGTKNKENNNEAFLRKLESYHLDYAKDNELLSIHPIMPFYLHVNDDDKSFILYYQNKKIIDATYDDFKNYKIYFNIDYEAKNRIPDSVNRGIKYFSIKINFKNNDFVVIDLLNYYSGLRVSNNVNYLQYTNMKMINNLATIIDQILRNNKKHNK